LPRLVFNWNTGQLNFFLSIGFGTGFSKPASYSPWLLYFYIPIGTIVFWFRRKSLLPKPQETTDTLLLAQD